MKQAFLVLVIIVQYIPTTQGQILAFAPQQDKQVITGYSSTNFINYSSQPRISKNTIIGSIVAGSGLFVAAGGGMLYVLSAGGGSEYDQSNTGMQNLGLGLVVAGGAMLIVGSIVGINGVMHDHKGYNGWGIIAPKKMK